MTHGTVLLVGCLAGLLGLVVGSFLTVVVHRVPLGASLLIPSRSACPACGHPVRPYDNVPVLSWLVLRGRCRDCAAPIPWRYPTVELATTVLFVALTSRWGATPYLGAVLTMAAAGVALTVIDLRHGRLPFSITGVATVATVAFLVADGVVTSPQPIHRALLSASLWLLVYGGVWLLTTGRGMGLGDVALAPALGLLLGWPGWSTSLVGLAGGFVLGGVVGLALLASGLVHRRSRVPHGPFMLTGAGAALLVGDELAKGYFHLVGLA